jgi:uncharacterized protein (TIRG00374 family)
MMWKRLLYILSILLGIIGFCSIPFIVGVDDLLWTIGHVGWLYVLLFIINSSGSLLFPALGWWILMRAEGMPVSLGTAVQANLMGFPINLITPSMYLGGEPLKMIYVSNVYQVPERRVLATIMAAKFQELASLVLCMIGSTTVLIWHTDYFTKRNEELLVVIMIILAGLCGIILYVFARRFTPLVALIDTLARFGGWQHRIVRLRNLVSDLGDLIYTVFINRAKAFMLAQAITCLSAVSIFLRPWIFFSALPHVDVGFDQFCIIFVLTQLVNMFTIIPGSLGLFEGTMTGYASASGLGDDKGAAFALINRISDLTLVIIGIWLIAHYGLTKVARSRR